MHIFGKLPTDIIVNNILPYSYHIQSPQLLNDIRGFYEDSSIIENYYSYDYNNCILLFDIFFFLHNIENVLQRHYYYKNKNSFELYHIISINYDEKRFINTNRKYRVLLGLMTPNQRTQFINEFIIEGEQ